MCLFKSKEGIIKEFVSGYTFTLKAILPNNFIIHFKILLTKTECFGSEDHSAIHVFLIRL